MPEGYFKVSMDAAKAIVEQSDGPELLAGYIVVCNHAFGEGRAITAAGAKAIRLTLGCTDHRSKKILRDLFSVRFGSGQAALLTATKARKANAAIHRIEKWEGHYAYLPSLLLRRLADQGSALGRLYSDTSHSRAVIRDAMLLLLHVYASVDYAEWFGCPPDEMAYQEWRRDGVGANDFELGYQGDVADLPLWLVETVDTWSAPTRVMTYLYGGEQPQAEKRFWAALWCLIQSRQVVPVVSVQTNGRAYPLWVYSAAYRDSLRALDIIPDLGRETHLAACSSGNDPDNLVIRYAVDDMDRQGTGLFFCVGIDPIVRSVVVPRLHAPTPVNMDGLTEAADVTRNIWREIRAARREDRVA